MSQNCKDCKKWQESRNSCFYKDSKFVDRFLVRLFGCEKFNPWTEE